MIIDKILIIEDEKPNADRLTRLIKQIRPSATVMAVHDSIAESVEWLNSGQCPDVIMMDVRLSDGLSFEIFEKTDVMSPVIFTTAYDEYAVRAFKYNSIDYLLKPIQVDELEQSFLKLEATNNVNIPGAIKGLLNFLHPKDFRTRFLLPYRDGYKTLLVDDINYFYSEQRISKAKIKEGSFEIIPQTLEELEIQLNPKHFFRANRQFIIHIDSVRQVHNYFNGKLKIDLHSEPDLEILVSREKANLLKSWLDY